MATGCETQLGGCSLRGLIPFLKSTIPRNVLWKATKNKLIRCNLIEAWYSITTADPPRREHTLILYIIIFESWVKLFCELQIILTSPHPCTYSSPSHQTPFRYSWKSHAYILTLHMWGKHSTCPTVSTFQRDLKSRWHHWRPQWCVLQWMATV